MSAPPLAPYRAVVLDVEGTTTSISFVYDVLFPFARRALDGFLRERSGDPEVAGAIDALRAEAEAEGQPIAAGDLEGVLRYALALMDADRKSTGLKRLQGLIWRDGYRSGELRGHVYDDVPLALERWAARGIPAYIYSSGSVEAQRLLFGSSVAGDLTRFLCGHFDTTTGPKKEPASYRAIATALGEAPEAIVFLTDNLDEARAARTAGMQAAVAVRPGNPPTGAHDFPVLERFDLVASA